MKEVRRSSKSYELLKLSLINCWDQETDISDLMVTFTITESIFKRGITGTISITDDLGLFELMPLIGDEWIRLSYRTDWMGVDNPVYDRTFRVFRIDNGKQYTGRTRSYTIHFMSKEIEINQGTYVSKSYVQKTSDVIVKDIWSNVSEQDIECEVSVSAPRFVVPSMRPFDAITWLSNNSMSDMNNGDYMLYEDRDTWRWRTIRSMLEEDPIQTVTYNISDVSDLTAITKNNIEQIEFNRLYDTVEMGKAGMFGVKESQYSIINKTIGEETSLHTHPTYKEQSRVHGKPVEGDWGRAGYGVRGVYANDPETVYSGSHRDDLIRQQLVGEWFGNTWTITLPGNSAHTCGKLIELNIPSMRPSTKGEGDAIYGGEYLISDITHSFDRGEYTSDLTIRSNVVRD